MERPALLQDPERAAQPAVLRKTVEFMQELVCRIYFQRMVPAIVRAPIEYDRDHEAYRLDLAARTAPWQLPGLWFSSAELPHC
jgi:hypothetical protein